MLNVKEFDINSVTHFGIWKRKGGEERNVFQRDPALFYKYCFWANTLTIPHKEKFRIVFLGDSVAMGQYYQPEITPAKLLEKIVSNNMRIDKIEVVDLTCSYININDFKEFCLSIMSVQPDVIIIFIGNKWIKYTSLDISKYLQKNIQVDNLLKADISEISSEVDYEIKKMLEFLNEMIEHFKIPIFFILPEINLKDWDRGQFYYPISVKEGCINEYYKIRRDMEELIAVKDVKNLLDQVKKILELIQPHPYFYQLIGYCYYELGQVNMAEKYYRLSENLMGCVMDKLPLSIPFIRKKLLNDAYKYRIHFIDFQTDFHKYMYESISGKEFYMDYCHLTLKGMKAAMNIVALACMNFLGSSVLADNEKKVSDESDLEEDKICGKAHLLAAVTCEQEANQPYHILYHHCLKALEYWTKAKRVMELYIEFVTNKAPRFLHKNVTSLAKENFWPTFPDRSQLMGALSMENNLIEAMVMSIKEMDVGNKAVEKEIYCLRKVGFGPINGQINLLEPYYYNYTYYKRFLEFLPDALKDYAFYMAYDIKSIFFFYLCMEKDIELIITLKGSLITEGKKASLILNGKNIADLKVSDKWQTYNIEVKKSDLNQIALNTINLWWELNANYVEDISSVEQYNIYGYISRLKVKLK